jgi:hypothetical protein
MSKNQQTALGNAPVRTSGAGFMIGATRYTIVKTDKFGTTEHYGVTFQDYRGDYKSGWIPVHVVQGLVNGCEFGVL